MVQSPRTSLDPLATVGGQLIRVQRTHANRSRRDAAARAEAMLAAMGIPDPPRRMRSWPHELSGGMAQRVVIALALVNEPRLLVADEPTTGLDVTVQAQILDLLAEAVRVRRIGAIVITHDLGVVAQYCDDVAVMFAGQVMEQGPVATVFAEPAHPTRMPCSRRHPSGCNSAASAEDGAPPDLANLPGGCLYREPLPPGGSTLPPAAAVGRGRQPRRALHFASLQRGRGMTGPVAAVEGLHVHFGKLHALDGVDSWTSSPARCWGWWANPVPASQPWPLLPAAAAPQRRAGDGRRRQGYHRVAGIPPAPAAPGHDAGVPGPVGRIEPPHDGPPPDRGASAADGHGPGRTPQGSRTAGPARHLSLAHLDRLPSGLSGGQLQRVGIARAVATKPRLIVLDEPTSSLDLSVRAGILDLLAELRAETGVAMLFITHDLGSLRLIADRIAVLYLGRVVERGPAVQVMGQALHPYTQTLLSAHLPADPAIRPTRIRLSGEIPSPLARPAGCPFVTRCPLAQARCGDAPPPLQDGGGGQLAACVLGAGGYQPSRRRVTNQENMHEPRRSGPNSTRSAPCAATPCRCTKSWLKPIRNSCGGMANSAPSSSSATERRRALDLKTRFLVMVGITTAVKGDREWHRVGVHPRHSERRHLGRGLRGVVPGRLARGLASLRGCLAVFSRT